jgi:hypothetical protein
MKVYTRRKRRKDIWGAVLLALSLLAVLVGVYFYYRLSSSVIAVDRQTLCPADGPRSLTVVLIDMTDPLSAIQMQDVSTRLDQIKNKVPRWGEIELFTVGPIGNGLHRPDLTLCNPGNGSQVSSIYGNPGLAKKRWRTKFAHRIDQVLGKLLHGQPANTSPILESIQQVGVQSFGVGHAENIPKRLVIVSDMIQHTKEFSQYRGVKPFSDLRQSPYYLRVRTNLADVNVDILYLRRAQAAGLQGTRHIEFWQRYFEDAGATVDKVVSIQGR